MSLHARYTAVTASDTDGAFRAPRSSPRTFYADTAARRLVVPRRAAAAALLLHVAVPAGVCHVCPPRAAEPGRSAPLPLPTLGARARRHGRPRGPTSSGPSRLAWSSALQCFWLDFWKSVEVHVRKVVCAHISSDANVLSLRPIACGVTASSLSHRPPRQAVGTWNLDGKLLRVTHH